MAEQDGNPLYWHTGQEQLDSEGVPETMRMTARNFRESKKFFQAPLPVSYRALELPLAAPKKILLACAAHRFESLNHRIGKRTPNRSAGLGRVEEKFPLSDSFTRQTYHVADPQAGIAQQQQQSTQPARIFLAGPSVVISIGITRGQDAQPLFARERENLRVARFLTFEFRRRVLCNPTTRLSKAQERPQRFQFLLCGEIPIRPGRAKFAQRGKVQLAKKPQTIVTREGFHLPEQK